MSQQKIVWICKIKSFLPSNQVEQIFTTFMDNASIQNIQANFKNLQVNRLCKNFRKIIEQVWVIHFLVVTLLVP